MVAYPGFIGPSYESRAKTADTERTLNWYLEKLQSPGATQQVALYPFPGIEQVANASTSGGGRGHFFDQATQREFFAIGTGFYEVDRYGTITNRGTLAVDLNPATICSNGAGGSQLFITSGGNGYCFTLTTNTLTQIAALNGKATMGEFLDDYFFALDATTSTLYVSDLLDGSTWDTTNSVQRSLRPDPWVSMAVNNRMLWLLGAETSEVWYDIGATPPDFPLAPHPSGLVQYGIGAPFSIKRSGDFLYWVGATSQGAGSIVRTSGFNPQEVSTFAVQFAINGYARADDAIGDAYDDMGHTWYIVSFPTAGTTWAYDATLDTWTEAGTWIAERGAYTSWRRRYHVYAYGEHRWLDGETSALYRSRPTLYLDADSRPMRFLRRAPQPPGTENQRVFFQSLELDMEVGAGAQSTGQGANPRVMLRYSNDGGYTWGPELWRSMGKIGEYGTRVRFERLGMARKRVFEIVVTDPVAPKIVNAYLTLGQGPKGAAA